MSSAGTISVEVPDIGDFTDVPVIEILVAPGDEVAADDPLLTLESEKAAMDVPAPSAGVVSELHVGVGDKVSQGTVVLTLAAGGDDAPASKEAHAGGPTRAEAGGGDAPAPEEPEPSAPAEEPESSVPAEEPEPGAGRAAPAYASPSVRRLAREHGVDLASIEGSGRKGRITREDVGARGPAPASPDRPGLGLELAPWPSLDFEQFGPIERVQRSRIERISAPNLARNWVTIPHVTHNDEADITELESWRAQLNSEQDVKVTMVAFLVLACVATLHEFPKFNSSLDGDELVLKHYWNIGFAADTPGGLVVPVIKGADRKGLVEVASELGSLSSKAREGKLSPADMQGGTFTISSLGGIGGTSFTPIVNAPEVAILGVTRAAITPVFDGEQFLPRLMLPLSLSYDHRVIDGAAAARFVAHLAGVLSDLRRALL